MSPFSPTSADASGKLPLHIQVSEMLAREIQAGIYPDGTKLAPERDMAQELEISVGTLRKALADLTEKGLLERVHGSGNYVRKSDTPQSIYGFFRLELLKGGGLPTAEILSLRKLKKPRDLPQFGHSESGFRIRRWRRLNGVNAAIEEIWLDGGYAETIVQSDLTDSLYQYYRQQLNLWITRAEDSVGVAPPPAWKPDGFASNASIWGYIERHSFDQTNTVAEFSRTWFDPTTTRFMARWT
jgi:GntR family transcriptional regulator